MTANIHPLAHVESTAEVGDGTSVGPFAYVGPGVVIGEDNEICPHAVIEGPGTRIGDKNCIRAGAVIGGPPQDKSYSGELTRCELGNGNLVREHVTIHRGTVKGGALTRVGDDNLIMVAAHIAHDCRVGDGTILANGVLLAGHVVVEDFATMNGASAIHHFGTVGTMAYVGGLTRLSADVPPYMIVEGHPAKVKKVNSIGLSRRGIPQDRIDLLQRAFRHLFHRRYKGRTLKERLESLDATGMQSPELERLRQFLVAQSEGRGGRAQERDR